MGSPDPLALEIAGDGPLDQAMLPALIALALGCHLNQIGVAKFRAWKDIRAGGYKRKLQYVLRHQKAEGLTGVVAVVDRDKDKNRKRLATLQAARLEERQAGVDSPCAIGEARPHGEAWLLDDAEAVKAALGLPGGAKVPKAADNRDCKGALQDLAKETERFAERDSWAECYHCIAELTKIGSFRAPSRTGWKEFAADVRAELGSLVESAG